MEKFQDVVFASMDGVSPAAGALVYVYNHGTQTLASLFSDPAGANPLSNPLTTDGSGTFSFYAANGHYDITALYAGQVSYKLDVILLDPANAQSYVQVGGTVDNAGVGTATPAAGDFTTLQVSGSVSGAGFTSLNASPGPIGSVTPSSGAFTTLTSSGTTALGATSATSLNSTPIGGTTAAAGAFTTLSATSAITPSQTAGIVGTTTNNNANAGSVGEVISSTFSAVSMTSNTVTNLTSISLTAGDWDISGGAGYFGSGAPVGTAAQAGSNTVSATMGASGTYWILSFAASASAATMSFALPTNRISLTATTTVFCVGSVIFSGGTFTAAGVFRARRVR